MFLKLKQRILGKMPFRKRHVISIALFVFFGSLVVPDSARAGIFDGIVATGLNVLAALVYLIVGYVIQLVTLLIGHLLVGITDILIQVVQYNDFIFHNVVVTGWAIARDISNMFFVVILLAIAIGTILSLENYNLKRMLPRLLIVIILINFSKLIAGFIIDFAQVFMLTFAEAIKSTLAGNIFSKFGIGSLFDLNNIIGTTKVNAGEGYRMIYLVMSLVLALIMMVVAFFVVLVYLVIFLLRIIALWILIVLAPFAFLLSTFQKGEPYYREWWDNFINYVIAGPILIFFFWLALQTSEQALVFSNVQKLGIDPTKLGRLGLSPDEISAQIGYTQAGSPENVARFIVTTCLLLGGLMAAQRVQVAGAGFASSTMAGLKRQWGGFKPFARPLYSPVIKAGKAAGWAGKEFGGYVGHEILNLLGLPTAGKIKEAYKIGVQKLEERRTQKRLKKSREMMEGARGGLGGLFRTMYGGLGNPEYFFQHITRWKNVLTKEGQAAMTGGKFREYAAQLKEEQDILSKSEEEQWKEESPIGAGKRFLIEQIQEGEVEKEQKIAHKDRDDGKRDYQIQDYETPDGKEKIGSFKEMLKSHKISQDQLEELETNNHYNRATRSINETEINRLPVADRDAVRKRAEVIQSWDLAYDKKISDALKSALINIPYDEVINKIKSYYTDGKIDKAAIEAISDKNEQKKIERMVDFVEKIDKEEAVRRVIKDNRVQAKVRTDVDNKDDSYLAGVGREQILKRAGEQYAQGQLVEKNFLSKKEEAARKEEIDKLYAQRERATKDIDRQQGLKTDMAVRGESTVEVDKIIKKLQELQNKLDNDLKNLDFKDVDVKGLDGTLQTVKAYQRKEEKGKTEEERKEIEEMQKKRLERATKNQKEAQETKQFLEKNPLGLTEAERHEREEVKKAHGRRIEELKLEAEKYRMPVDYAARKEQRLAINKEKSDMTTDSWEELLVIYKDAVNQGDSIRAAAAYLKTTEFGNENEFQNALGFDSDAEGVRQLVEQEFVGKLKMDEELAKSIANDISYIGEKGMHWGVARKVGIDKLGRQEWKSEVDRQKEVTAEVRKQDFENFMRRANRLAYGNERVRGDTRRERMMNFSQTGERDFSLNAFGRTFILENYDKFQPIIDRGRFNVNLGVKISSGDNPRMLRELAKLTDDPYAIHRMLDQIAQKAHVAGGEFERFDEIYRRMGLEV